MHKHLHDHRAVPEPGSMAKRGHSPAGPGLGSRGFLEGARLCGGSLRGEQTVEDGNSRQGKGKAAVQQQKCWQKQSRC